MFEITDCRLNSDTSLRLVVCFEGRGLQMLAIVRIDLVLWFCYCVNMACFNCSYLADSPETLLGFSYFKADGSDGVVLFSLVRFILFVY